MTFSFTVLSTFLLGSNPINGGVANPRCNGHSGYSVPRGEGKSFFCRPPLYGKYVTIRSLKNDALTLCEVEVYSERRGMIHVNSYSKIWNLDQKIQLKTLNVIFILILVWS